MAREDPQLKLRLADDLKERVVRAARANNRSVNAEIVHALEVSFPAPEPGNLSLPEVIRLQDAWREAMGLDLKDSPPSSDILRSIWRYQIGDVADMEQRLCEAAKAALAAIGRTA